MEQSQRVILCMTEYRVIKERNLHGIQSRLHIEMTEGRDDYYRLSF
ncbi:MAG: hypothetical protein HDR17_01135 [Lachnospiraceae bacterium]|nr:hypothetical protein [Lachnospiraceae bacterium]